MGNFWRGAAEVGNALYDYVGDKKKWELADTTNELQRMRAEKLKSDIEEGKQESIAMKSVSPYTTTTTETPEYQGVVTPPDPNEGYSAPPESALMRQTTTQTPKPSYQYKREIAQALAKRGQVKAANMYMDDAAKDEQTVHTNLWNSLKFAVDKKDDNMANSILENAPDSFLQATGMRRGEKFSGGGEKLEGTIDASKTPFYDALGVYQTEGVWDYIQEKGKPVKTIRKDKADKAPTSPFQSYRAGQIAKGNTDESKIASGWKKEQKELAREGGRNVAYEKNMFMAAKAAGVDAKKIASGTATQKEVQDTLTEYSKRFGAQSLIQMLVAGGGGGGNAVKFDSQGNAIE